MARLRQALRRTLRRLRPPSLELVYSGRYVVDLPAVPIDPHRGENLLTFLAAEGLARRGALKWPQPASLRSLCRVHDPAYLDRITAPGALERVVGFALTEAEEDAFLTAQREMVGGTLLATRLALEGRRPAINLGGGLHHAHADRGQGFCALNDVAVAIAGARADGFEEPVLVVDLDLHDGDGTRSIFADDPGVYTFSIHNRHWGETAAVASTALALGAEVDDATYLDAVEKHLPPVVRAFAPGLVYYLAGCDPAADDLIGDWQISAGALLARDRFVVETLRRVCGEVPLVVALAGGYGSTAWRYSARFLSWLALGEPRDRIPPEPPSTEAITLERFRHLSQLLAPADLTSAPGDDDWGLSEEDLMPGLSRGQRRTRFLGYYSRHGVELALERYGFLHHLRRLGFGRPVVELDLDNPAGETLRVFGDEAKSELVGELRLRRDRLLAPGLELLAAEWLLLQNPRARFGEGRSALPGQRHPGLGLLRETTALLVMICERLGLDGLVFTPAHYHLAAQSPEALRFLDPADQARFRALAQAVARLPLGKASRAIDGGRVIEEASGEPLVWKPAPMVLPVSDRLQRRVESEEYEAAVEEELGALELVLEPG